MSFQKIRNILFLLLWCMPSANNCLADKVDTDFQLWFMASLIAPIDEEKKFSVYLEAQPRIGDDAGSHERLILRSAAVYNINPDLSIYLGGAWTPSYLDQQYETNHRDEYRIWQQLNYLQRFEGLELTLTHRLREEQRFIEDTDGAANRMRYLLRVSRPWKAGARWGATSYNEYFLNLDSVPGGPKAGFDRDRFFLGPYLTDGQIRYEVGYLFEYSNHFDNGNRVINGVLTWIHMNF